MALMTCVVLNNSIEESTISPNALIVNKKPSKKSFIISDSDEELLILIQFTHNIDLQQIKLYALPLPSTYDLNASPPKIVHIYKTNNLNINFNDLSSMNPEISIKCESKALVKGCLIKLQRQSQNAVKFKKVQYLVIYIQSNQNDTEQTYLNGIKLGIHAINNTMAKAKHFTNTGNTSIANNKSNDNVFANKLAKMVVAEYFNTDNILSDQHKMSNYLQFENKMRSNPPQKFDWSEKSEHDLLQYCPDYMKIKPCRNDIDFTTKQNPFMFNKYSIANKNCDIKHCQSATNIYAILERYQLFISAQSQNEESKSDMTFDMFFGDDFDTVNALNNFHHLLLDHSLQFEDIYDMLILITADNICSLEKCSMLSRHYSDRSAVNCSHEMLESVEESLLDAIHCYYFHSFDIGYRFTKATQKKLWNEPVQESKEQFQQNNNHTYTYNNVDANIHKFVAFNRRSRKQVHGLGRINIDNTKNNKFKTHTDAGHSVYDHGTRFFYWEHYKDRDEINDTTLLQNDFIGGTGYQRARGDEIEANIGYKVMDWYIPNKYNDLKNEFLNNKVCRINLSVWQRDAVKAARHLQTDYAKAIRSRGMQQYGIKSAQSLNVSHIIAMMSYCNHDTLQARFSETFRRRVNENDLDLKQRHSNFANFARLLREVVECYGQQNIDAPSCGNQRLFHGISKQSQFKTVNPCFKGPISSTTDYSVAVNFCGDSGCIIQFKLNKTWLYQRGMFSSNRSTGAFMDVAWLSDYPNEQERFFIGGYSRFYIESIVMIPNINYCEYINAMRGIWQKIGYLDAFSPPVLSDIASHLTWRMLSHEFNRYWPQNKHYHSFSSMPDYIDTLFHNFCINLREVDLFAMARGCSSYGKLDKVLDYLFLYDKGIPKLKEIMRLFPAATEIIIKTNCNGKSEEAKNLEMINDDEFWKLLLVDLRYSTALKQLIVDFSSKSECVNIIKTMGGLYAHRLKAIGWKVALGTSQRYGNADYTLIIESAKVSGKIVTD